jgi:hypothetical protein
VDASDETDGLVVTRQPDGTFALEAAGGGGGGGVTDAELLAIAGLTSAANRLPYFTGSGTAALTDLSPFGRTLIDDADAAAALATLGAQPLDAELSAIAGLTSAANALPYFTGSGTAALTDLSPFGRTLIDDADAAAARVTLGAQPLDAELSALATLTSAPDALPYFSGVGAAAVTTLSAFGRSLIDDADAATARGTLGAQPLDAELTALAGLTSAANALPYFTGSGTAAVTTLSAFGRSLIDDADAATARGTLGAQGVDPELTALAGLTSAANALPYFTGSGTAAVTTLSAFGRTLIDDADALTALGTLGAQPADPELTAIAGLTSAANRLPYFTGVGTAALTDLSAYGRTLIASSDAIAARNTLEVARVQYPLAPAGHFFSSQDQASAASSFTVTADRVFLVPFRFDADITWDEIYVNVTTAAAGNMRLGIYTGGMTSLQLDRGLDAGIVSVSTSGTKSIAGLSLFVRRGELIWLAFLSDVAPILSACSFGSLRSPLFAGTTGVASGYPVGIHFPAPYVSGLPASINSAWTFIGSSCPTVGLRRV